MKILKTIFSIAGLCLALCGISHAGKVTYIHTDAQGTPVMESDAQGNIIARFDYTPYGVQALGAPPAGPGYTGHVNDPDTGLVYMQARYYDPLTGRFLSSDPVKPEVANLFNFNRYNYANNNPIANVDTDGRRVTSTDFKNNAYIAGLINSKALGTFKFDKSNNLIVINSKGDSSRFSTYYQTKLIQAIKSPNYITVNVAKDVKTKTLGTLDVNKSGGGITLGSKNGGTQAITISGDSNTSMKDASGNALRDSPGDILAHEFVGHAIPHITGSDTGNAVENENKVRAEIPGSGKRPEEPSHVE